MKIQVKKITLWAYLALLSASPLFGSQEKINADLWQALKAGNVSQAETAIKAGADVNKQDASGETPLTWEVKNNKIRFVQLLIDNRVSVNQENNQNETPLGLAAKNGYVKIARLLLANVADPNKSSGQPDSTPLILALENNHKEMAELLLKNKADPNMGRIKINVKIRRLTQLSLEVGRIKTIDEGQEYSIFVPPLLWAIRENKLESVKMLLENGADPNKKISYDNISNGFTEPITQLGYVSIVTTPLLEAVKMGDSEVVNLLLNNGARVNEEGSWRPRSFSKDINLVPLLEAVRKDNIEITNLLLKNGAEVNKVSLTGWSGRKDLTTTPLIEAVQKAKTTGKTEMVKLLLDNGANPATQVNIASGSTGVATVTALSLVTASLKPALIQLFATASVKMMQSATQSMGQ